MNLVSIFRRGPAFEPLPSRSAHGPMIWFFTHHSLSKRVYKNITTCMRLPSGTFAWNKIDNSFIDAGYLMHIFILYKVCTSYLLTAIKYISINSIINVHSIFVSHAQRISLCNSFKVCIIVNEWQLISSLKVFFYTHFTISVSKRLNICIQEHGAYKLR